MTSAEYPSKQINDDENLNINLTINEVTLDDHERSNEQPSPNEID